MANRRVRRCLRHATGTATAVGTGKSHSQSNGRSQAPALVERSGHRQVAGSGGSWGLHLYRTARRPRGSRDSCSCRCSSKAALRFGFPPFRKAPVVAPDLASRMLARIFRPPQLWILCVQFSASREDTEQHSLGFCLCEPIVCVRSRSLLSDVAPPITLPSDVAPKRLATPRNLAGTSSRARQRVSPSA